MAHRTDKAETGGDQVRLPAGVVLKPPVSLDDLKTDTEYDPERGRRICGPDPRAPQGRLIGPSLSDGRHNTRSCGY